MERAVAKLRLLGRSSERFGGDVRVLVVTAKAEDRFTPENLLVVYFPPYRALKTTVPLATVLTTVPNYTSRHREGEARLTRVLYTQARLAG